jgi:hypothetical protein
LENDNRANILLDLFAKNNSNLDPVLFQNILNLKFESADSLTNFYHFIEKNGGKCHSKTQCKLPISSTICISNTLIINIEDSILYPHRFSVKDRFDAC